MVNKYKLVSNTLEQFISAITKLLDFFLLADICTLRFDKLFRSSEINLSTYPISRLNQLRPRRYTPVYGLDIVSDYTG